MTGYAQRLAHMSGSATARATGASPIQPRLDLGVGCPDWSPPAACIAAAQGALGGSMAYGSPGGQRDLRARLTESSSWHGSTAELQSVVTSGGKEALFHGLGAIVSPGDRVVVCAPYWPSFPEQIRAWGGVPIPVAAGEDGLPHRPQLWEALRSSKAIIVNSPGNPSGRLWPPDLFESLAAEAAAADAWVLLDGVYGGLCAPGHDPLPGGLPHALNRRTLVVDSASKQYALPGLRIGWATGPPAWIDAIRTLQDAATTHPSIVAQAALSAALDAEAPWLPSVRARLEERREAIRGASRVATSTRWLNPEAGLFGLVEVPGAAGRDMARELLEKDGIRVLPGAPFGAPDHLRVALTAEPADLAAAAAAIDLRAAQP